MSKIYTKTGDKGKTSLLDGTRVFKNHIRVETYGTIDELNSTLGVVLAHVVSSKYQVVSIKNQLQEIQRDLLDIGSRLSNPKEKVEEKFVKYLDERITTFEKEIDAMTIKMPELTNFILPSGGIVGAQLHVARTIARRVERRIIELLQQESVDGSIIRYFNRLSDLLFTMSRFANFKEKKKENIWEKRI